MPEFDKIGYITEYNRKNYDDIKIRVPAGQRDEIKKQALEKGYKSLNAYILDLIKKDKER